MESASLPRRRRDRSGHHAGPLQRFRLEIRPKSVSVGSSRLRRERPPKATAPTTAGTTRTPSQTRWRGPRTPTRSLVHCRSSRDKQPRALARSASAFEAPSPVRRPVSARGRSCSPSPARRASASALARRRAPVSSKSVTDMRSMRAPCVWPRRARRMPSICVAAARRHACRSRTMEPPTTRGETSRASPSSHAGAERSNCMTYCSASLVERRTVALALREGRRARAMRAPTAWCRCRFRCPLRAAGGHPAAWPLANRSAAFSSTAHSPGFACATSNEACAGAHWARLAPVHGHIAARPVRHGGARPCFPPCAVSSRAEPREERTSALNGSGFSWPVV